MCSKFGGAAHSVPPISRRIVIGALAEIEVDREGQSPIYAQIVEQVKSRVANGELVPGDPLPTVRKLAERLSISRLTVFRAYQELKTTGLVECTVGRGTIIAGVGQSDKARRYLNRLTEVGPQPLYEAVSRAAGIRSFATALPDPDLFHVDELAASYQSLRDLDPWDLYLGPAEGHPLLVAEFAKIASRLVPASNERNILVTPGPSIASVVRLLEPGSVAIQIEPIVGSVCIALERNQITVHAMDAGIAEPSLEALAAWVKETRAKAIFYEPCHGLGTGRRFSDRFIMGLRDLAERMDFLVFEMHACSHLAYEKPPTTAFDAEKSDRVVILFSTDHLLGTNLGLGMAVLPNNRRGRLARDQFQNSIGVSSFAQIGLARYLQAGHFQSTLRKVRPIYKERRDSMVRTLEQNLPTCCKFEAPTGGMVIWLGIPEKVSIPQLYSECLEKGVAILPDGILRAQSSVSKGIRLSFSMTPTGAISPGISTFCNVLKRHLG